MRKMLHLVWIPILLLPACYKEIGVPVSINFSAILLDSSRTVPVSVNFANLCSGATHYKWTFEGGDPAGSGYENPGTVIFNTAGTYKVKLEAWNEDEWKEKTIILQLDSAVNVSFDAVTELNDFSPVTVKLMNHTTGASSYNWTFEGGDPASANIAQPGPVTFTTPGNHQVTLTVSNGGQQFSSTRTVSVKPPLAIDMSMEAGFQDDDGEAPLTAYLDSKSQQYLTLKWFSTGGIIQDDTLAHTTLYFKDPGTYTVKLQVANGKETKMLEKEIVVKPNSRLRTLKDVKLGISAAHADIGSFYSTRLRRVFKKEDDLSAAGKEIDIVFFGLSFAFTYNKFISPAFANDYTLPVIPGATATRFVNSTESCGCSTVLTVDQFDQITDDSLLQSLRIDPATGADKQFDNTLLPRVVLFQTQDGRKGAIKIKQFVADGKSSYILTDIKIQKHE